MALFQHEFQRILDLSREKIKLFEQLLLLTEKQKAVIGIEEKLVHLENLIQVKQKVIDKVNAMDQNITVLVKQVDQMGKPLKEEDFRAKNDFSHSLAEMDQQISDLARRIQALEAENIQSLTVNLDEMKAKLQTVRNGKKVTNYFTKPIQNGGYFLNRRR